MRQILAFLLLFFLFTGCERRQDVVIRAEGEAAKPAYGDTIIWGSIGDATTLLPVLASDSASSDINGLIYNGLVRYDKNLQTEPGTGRIVGDFAG